MARPTASSVVPRGSALLFVMVILAVLAVVGVAIINRASSETDASVSKRKYDKSLACADEARELLLSQFRLFGLSPTQLTLSTPVDETKTLRSGHYDTAAITSITLSSGATAGAFGEGDIANTIRTKASLGGQLYQVAAVCTSPNNTRQSEVEFLVRFGL